MTMGLISAGPVIGAAAGAFMGGNLVDMSARYDAIWLNAITLSLGAGAMVFLLREQPKAPAVPA